MRGLASSSSHGDEAAERPLIFLLLQIRGESNSWVHVKEVAIKTQRDVIGEDEAWINCL